VKALRLTIAEDVRIPLNATLVIECLGEFLRIPVSKCYNSNKGVYIFDINNPPSGASCRAVIETPESSWTLFESVDLHTQIQKLAKSTVALPLPIFLSPEFINHKLEVEEQEFREEE
jgi:hypothetical protein